MRISRIITTWTTSSQIDDGTELRTHQTLPSSWNDGDMVVARFEDQEFAVFFADPEQHADAFDYLFGRTGYLGVRLERLHADERGEEGLRVRLQEHHKEIIRHSREINQGSGDT